jgi:hypothetical protein
LCEVHWRDPVHTISDLSTTKHPYLLSEYNKVSNDCGVTLDYDSYDLLTVVVDQNPVRPKSPGVLGSPDIWLVVSVSLLRSESLSSVCLAVPCYCSRRFGIAKDRSWRAPYVLLLFIEVGDRMSGCCTRCQGRRRTATLGPIIIFSGDDISELLEYDSGEKRQMSSSFIKLAAADHPNHPDHRWLSLRPWHSHWGNGDCNSLPYCIVWGPLTAHRPR